MISTRSIIDVNFALIGTPLGIRVSRLLLLLLLTAFGLILGHLLLLPSIGAGRLRKFAIQQLVGVHMILDDRGGPRLAHTFDRLHRDYVWYRLSVLLEIDADITADTRQQIDLLQFCVGRPLFGRTLGIVAVTLRLVVVGRTARRRRRHWLMVAYFDSIWMRQLLCLTY